MTEETSPPYEYVLYVDEAGDVGTRTKSEGDRGSTEWFGVGGFVVSRRHEAEMAEWVRTVRSSAGVGAAKELHYKTLDERRRLGVTEAVAQLPLAAFVVLSHKENMRGYKNSRAAAAGGEDVFYNFCLRVLLERVSASVRSSSLSRFGKVTRLKVVIAQTGAVRYSQTIAYIELLRMQARAGTTYLSAATIDPQVLDMWQIEKVSAKSTAGCQIADVIVSAFYNCVNETGKYPLLCDPALRLRPVMAKRFSKISNVGLRLLPWDAAIPERYRFIFEEYGYGWPPA